jgi:hypothetical protein
MERIRDSVSKSLPPLRIYTEELRELTSFLSETCETFTIMTCGYRLESIDELSQLPKHLAHDLDIEGTNPRVRVRLTPVGGDIHVYGGDVQCEGIAARIENILRAGRLRMPLLPGWVPVLSGLPLLVAAPSRHVPTIALAGIVAFLIVVWTVYDGFLKLRRYNTIIFKARQDCPSFWERKNDEIILLIVGAVVGSLITLLINALVGK